MRFGALPYTLILVWMTGMGLAAMPQAQVASGTPPESHVKTPDHPTPAVDLSQKNVLVLHGLESNVPISELTDRGIKTVLDSGGVGIRNQFFEYLDLVRNPGPLLVSTNGAFLIGAGGMSITSPDLSRSEGCFKAACRICPHL